MDATWHARPCGPTRRLRGEVTRGCYLYLSYIGLIMYIGLPIIGRQIINPLKPLHVINLTLLFNFSRVGLSSTRFL